MLHQSTASVGAGELLASFPLRLRNSGPEPEDGYRYRGTVVCLHAAPDEVSESSYQVKMGLTFEGGEECYQAYFVTPFAKNSSPVSVGERMEAYNAKARAHYPYLTRIPSVRYEKEAGGILGRFVVTLPPFTSIYTSSVGFWDTLGFEEDSYSQFPGAKLKNSAASVLAFGFTNRTSDQYEATSRQMTNETEPLHGIYEAFAAGASSTTRPYLEFRMFQDLLPLALAKKRAMTRNLVADGLATVIDDGLHLLSVDPSAVYIETSGKNLVLRSKEFHRQGAARDSAPEDARASVHLLFSAELREYLQLEEERLVFPLADSRSYETEPRDEVTFDPLEEHYPVSLVLQQGEAKNYVEGRGFLSLLGVMRGREDFVGDGSVFYGDCDQLTVRFLDKRLQPIFLRDRATTFTLTTTRDDDEEIGTTSGSEGEDLETLPDKVPSRPPSPPPPEPTAGTSREEELRKLVEAEFAARMPAKKGGKPKAAKKSKGKQTKNKQAKQPKAKQSKVEKKKSSKAATDNSKYRKLAAAMLKVGN